MGKATKKKKKKKQKTSASIYLFICCKAKCQAQKTVYSSGKNIRKSQIKIYYSYNPDTRKKQDWR